MPAVWQSRVIDLTAGAALQADVGRALQLASNRADTVVLMPAGNVGNAPFFPRPLSWLMRRRSLRLHAIARGAAARANAIYVNNYKEGHEDPFVRDARRLNAADGCIRATTATGSGSAHCRRNPLCRSGWRPWL